MKDVFLFYPEGSKIVNLRAKLAPGLWVSKTTGCLTMADAKKAVPQIIEELYKLHNLDHPKAGSDKNAASRLNQSANKSIVALATKALDKKAKRGRWVSAHIYYNALDHMRRGFGKFGELPPESLPEQAFEQLCDYLSDSKEIAKSASEYARRIRWILKKVPGVPAEHLELLARLPGAKGDGEKGQPFKESQLKTILIKQRTEEDETTRILTGIGLSGGPQIVDACLIEYAGVDLTSGLIVGRRAKSREEFRFYGIPWLIDLIRQRWERCGRKGIYVLDDLMFTRAERRHAGFNSKRWEKIPKEIVNRAAINGSNKVRHFLVGVCGFQLGQVTFKSFRINRISFWASVGFKLKSRMRMAGHTSVERHTAYDRGAESEIKRAAQISWKYYEAVEQGQPFFIPTTPYDLYETITDLWGKLPEIVRDSMRQELDGSFAKLEESMADSFAAQKVFFWAKFEALHREIAELKSLVMRISADVQTSKMELVEVAA